MVLKFRSVILFTRSPLGTFDFCFAYFCFFPDRWRRQTRLRQVGAAGGLRGDVYYFAPCGKKLRTYPEVTRVSSNMFKFVCSASIFVS